MNVEDITILSLQFHSNGSFRAITMANQSDCALQNPFTCVLLLSLCLCRFIIMYFTHIEANT